MKVLLHSVTWSEDPRKVCVFPLETARRANNTIKWPSAFLKQPISTASQRRSIHEENTYDKRGQRSSLPTLEHEESEEESEVGGRSCSSGSELTPNFSRLLFRPLPYKFPVIVVMKHSATLHSESWRIIRSTRVRSPSRSA